MKTKFEERFVKPNTKGAALVIGSRVYGNKPDRRQFYNGGIGIDMVDGPGVDIVGDMTVADDRVRIFHDYHVTHVDCVSMLEHCKQPWKATENIEMLLPLEGTIFLTVPFIWRIHAYPDDYFRFSKTGVEALFPNIEWKKLEYVVTPNEAGQHMVKAPKGFNENGKVYMERTEVYGFGVKK